MNNIQYEIELSDPSYFVTIEAPEDAAEYQLLELAIMEMTRKTYIFNKRALIKKKETM
jgi:hypothetical protein